MPDDMLAIFDRFRLSFHDVHNLLIRVEFTHGLKVIRDEVGQTGDFLGVKGEVRQIVLKGSKHITDIRPFFSLYIKLCRVFIYLNPKWHIKNYI